MPAGSVPKTTKRAAEAVFVVPCQVLCMMQAVRGSWAHTTVLLVNTISWLVLLAWLKSCKDTDYIWVAYEHAVAHEGHETKQQTLGSLRPRFGSCEGSAHAPLSCMAVPNSADVYDHYKETLLKCLRELTKLPHELSARSLVALLRHLLCEKQTFFCGYSLSGTQAAHGWTVAACHQLSLAPWASCCAPAAACVPPDLQVGSGAYLM